MNACVATCLHTDLNKLHTKHIPGSTRRSEHLAQSRSGRSKESWSLVLGVWLLALSSSPGWRAWRWRWTASWWSARRCWSGCSPACGESQQLRLSEAASPRSGARSNDCPEKLSILTFLDCMNERGVKMLNEPSCGATSQEASKIFFKLLYQIFLLQVWHK